MVRDPRQLATVAADLHLHEREKNGVRSRERQIAVDDAVKARFRSIMSACPPSVTIREAAANDVPAVVTLVRQVLLEFGLQFGTGSETDAQLAGLPHSYTVHGGAFWIALVNGSLLGTCGVFPIDESTFELRKMYLLQGARGQGIGKQLLAVATAFCEARGGRRLVLDTVAQMQQAIAFYEAHGFVRDDSQIRGARCDRGYALLLGQAATHQIA
jgi:GNAT superfamily N-acetyltransferase